MDGASALKIIQAAAANIGVDADVLTFGGYAFIDIIELIADADDCEAVTDTLFHVLSGNSRLTVTLHGGRPAVLGIGRR